MTFMDAVMVATFLFSGFVVMANVIFKRMEAKKKGSVLRVNTRVQPQEKKEEGYQPESRTDFVKRRIHEARVRQGLEPPPKK